MSVPFSARDAAVWTGGTLLHGAEDARFAGVSIDTRSLQTGQLFVAIVGPRHDAHTLQGRALEAGAAGLLVERGRPLPNGVAPKLPVIGVDDTTRALGALAAGHRAGFTGPLVGITGSNGKTTTKDMCAAILSRRAPCLRTEGNLNNQFGVPLTLLRRAAGDRTAVIELGMNHRGEIAALSAIARPTIGVLTNVGTAHIEHLGSREEIAREKGDLLAALPADGTAVVNADDPLALAQASRSPASVRSFGRGGGADVRAEGLRPTAAGFAFELVAPEGRIEATLDVLAEPIVSNALGSAAAALAAGATLDEVAHGLAACRGPRGRLTRLELAGGGVLIDDSYNANPQSMAAAIEALGRRPSDSQGFAVLGDMGELGEHTVAGHREVGACAAKLGIDGLVAVGAQAGEVAEGALAAGMAKAAIVVCADRDAAIVELRARVRPGDWVLVKGSRAMRMEEIVAALAAAEPC